MWMCYSERSWPQALNLQSAVERLTCELLDLERDAEHEAVYGMGRLFDEKYCKQLAKKYRRGVKLCEKYLKTKKCGECLCRNLIRVDLKEFTEQIRKFIPGEESIEEESTEEESTEEEITEEEVQSGIVSDTIESTSTECNEAESKI